ncbi:MAG TPA: hypothetical protein VGI52_07930 [Solirubrobacteraceae bacterium]
MLATTGCLLAPTAAAGAPTTIATLHTSTAVEAYGDVVTWSDYVAAEHSWHIVVQRDGQIATLPRPTAAKAFEVDVGPDAAGVPTLAYVDCAGGCHLVVSAVDGSNPQTVPDSRGASHPTIWGDRVAWVSAGVKVIVSRWNGSERRTLAGAPRRKCYYSSLHESAGLICARPRDPSVDALQLSGRRLALVDTFILNDHVGAVGTTTEVRTETIGGGAQRLVALLGVGEGDESWLGPSWSDGDLYFYEDSVGAGFFVYRFDPATGAYEKAPAYSYLTGFSVVAGRADEATSPGNPEGGHVCGEEAIPCDVRVSDPFVLKRAKAPVHVP